MENVFKYATKRRIPPRAGSIGNPPMQQLLHPFKVVILSTHPQFSGNGHFAHHGTWLGRSIFLHQPFSSSVNVADEADSDITS
mmetsp:Transcript_24384/g.31252  ORF Transcript_24384/g.31252 Transcript_24384/m.31252 type:complete len:83 (+) Transcript_24384:85-333(+)